MFEKSIFPRRNLLAGILTVTIAFEVVLCLFALFTTAGQTDEYTDLNIGWRWYQGQTLYEEIFSKRPPLAHLLLTIPPALTADPIDQFNLSRLGVFLISVISVYCVFVIARSLMNTMAGLIAVTLLVSSPGFHDFSFLIRMDTLSTAFFLMALALLFTGRFSRWSIALAGLMGGLGMVVTQKAVYFALNLLLLAAIEPIVIGRKDEKALSRMLENILMLGVLLATPFLVFLAWAYVAGIWESAVNLTVRVAFYVGMQYGGFEEISSDFMRLVLQKEYIVIPFGVVGMILALREIKSIESDGRRRALLGISVLVSALFFLWHKSKWGYFFWTILPSLCVMGGIFLEGVMARLLESGRRTVWLGMAPALFYLAMNTAENIDQINSPMKLLQNTTLAQYEKITDADEPVFSAMSFPHNRNRCYPYDLHLGFIMEYGEGMWPRLIPALKERECGFFTRSWALQELPAEEKRFLAEHYVRLWGEIHVAGRRIFRHELQNGPVPFEIIKLGEYVVLSRDGEAIHLDNRIIKSGVVYMDKGTHTVSSTSNTSEILIMYRIKAKAPLAEDPGEFPLFGGGSFVKHRMMNLEVNLEGTAAK